MAVVGEVTSNVQFAGIEDRFVIVAAFPEIVEPDTTLLATNVSLTTH
jgi:hypothetical protein